MMKSSTGRLRFFYFLGAMLTLFSVNRAQAGDPELFFRTIETEHFKIHYHQGLEATARTTASICEEVHENLSISLGWEIDGPTHVVIVDSTDSANGSASVYYRPVIRLFATSPSNKSSLKQHDHWLRTLITHEYTHIIHLSIHSGVSRFINAIFGDIYLPNTIAPTWYPEGIAVLNETYETSAGRIRSALYRMTIRAAALEDTLHNLGQMSNPTRSYPRGSDYYIYGAMFMDYLHSRFGMEKIVDIFHIYGSSTLPFGFNRAFKEALGTDLITLYKEWKEHVTAEAQRTKHELEAKGITKSTPITDDGESKGRPIFDLDGKHVIMGIANGMEKSGLFRVPLNGSPHKRLVLSGSHASIDRSGRLFYTRTAPFKSYYWFNDIFVLTRPGADPRRVTHGARARGVAISPKGDRLVMVLNKAGTSKLVLADERGHLLKTLVDSAPNDNVYEPTWSPNNKHVAVVIRQGPKVDIAVINVEDGKIELVTKDRAMEESPAFDATGRYLLFGSDRSGIDNIYAYDFKQKRLLQITNVVTGAFSPAVSKDGKTLAFLHYSIKGYDLHTMPFEPDSAEEAESIKTKWEPVKPPPTPSNAETKPYNPLPSMVPHYWMINASVNTEWKATLQVLTALSDAVGRHNVGVGVNYDVNNEVVSASGAYGYSGLGPGIHLGMSHTLSPRDTGYTVGGNSRDWIQQITNGSLSLSFPIYGVDRSHGLSLGYSVTHARPRDEPQVAFDPREPLPSIPDRYFRSGLNLGWSFSDLISSPFGISPHKGRSLSASVELSHPTFGGNQTLATFHYHWTEYLAMPWLDHHVLAARISGGIHVSDPPKQATFSVGGYGEQNIVNTIWNNAQLGTPTLRGYPQSSLHGDQYHSLRLSYRLPVWFAEAAYGTIPVYLRHIQAGVFTDNILISMEPLDRDDWRSSLGAELVWVLNFSYYQTMSLRTGYAYGFMEGGMHEVILVIGGGF